MLFKNKIINVISIALISSLSCITCDMRASGAKHISKEEQSTVELSGAAKEARKRYKEAVKHILETQPTTVLGDIAREIVSGVGSMAISKAISAATGKKGEGLAYAVSFLAIRLLFDMAIRDKGSVDKDLDVLISQERLDLDGLYAADIDFKDIEKKVSELGNKAEWARWIVRISQLIGLIGECSGFEIDRAALKVKGNPQLKINRTEPAWLSGASILIMLPIFWYVVVMQSATWKNSTRKQKLEQLKQLLKKAKKEAKTESPAEV